MTQNLFFTLKHDERFTIRLVHQIKQQQKKRIDFFFSIPKEMGVNSNVLDIEQFLNANILGKRAYISQMVDLPLVQSRFISMMKQDSSAYRVNLNVFVYHCLHAFERETSEIARLDNAHDFYEMLQPMMLLLETMLVRFRDTQPDEPKWQVYFEQADNYLSWSIEQRLLKLVSKAPKSSGTQELRERILEFCQAENNYRYLQKYNSTMTMSDPNRIANKMILLKRLVEQGVVFKEEIQELGGILKKIVKGVATALVMLVVYSLVIHAASLLSGVTVALVCTLAVIYGFREIFKDDVRQAIWNYLQRGRPKFSRKLIDGVSKKIVAIQKIWCAFIKQSDMPKVVQKQLKRRHKQNRQDSEYLHYRIETSTVKGSFRHGYQGIQEQIIFNLSPFSRNLERGQGSVFTEQNGKISKHPIEKRYQVGMVIGVTDKKDETSYLRYKITMNRSGIIDVEERDVLER